MRECKSRIMVYLQNILSPKKPNQSKSYITDGLTTQIIKKNKEPSLVTKKKKLYGNDIQYFNQFSV